MRSSQLGILATLLAGLLGLLAYLLLADGGAPQSHFGEVYGADELVADSSDDASVSEREDRAPDTAESERIDLALDDELETSTTSEQVDLSLRGRVFSAAGQPVSGARVLIEVELGWMRVPLGVENIKGLSGWRKLQEAKTNDAGEFSFPDTESATYVLEVLDPDHQTHRVDSIEYFDEKGLDLGELVLEFGAVLRGQVVDERGRGVAGALVLESLGTPRVPNQLVVPGRGRPLGESGANGRFSFANLAPGEFKLIVDSPEHLPVEVDASAVLSGETPKDLIVRLDLGSELKGQVRGLPTARLAQLRITARPKNGTSDATAGRPRTVPCDASGAFRIGGLAGGQDYRLTAFELSEDEEAQPERLPEIDPVYARPGDSGVVLALKKPYKLHFRVVNDKTDEPVAAFVALAGFEKVVALQEDGKTKQQHAGGLVRFDNLVRPNGAEFARLVIRAVGFAELEKGSLRLKQGEENDLGELRLAPAPRLLVTVTDGTSGSVVSTADVLVNGLDSKQALRLLLVAAGDEETREFRNGVHGAAVDETGKAALPLITGEPSMVTVIADGYAVTELPEQHFRGVEDVELRVQLFRGGEVRVQVKDQLGRPVEGITVVPNGLAATAESNSWVQLRPEWNTDAKGEVVFGALARGSHGFRLQREDEETGNSYIVLSAEDDWQEVTVREGESHELEFVVQSRSVLSGTVFESGYALADAKLALVALENGKPRREPWRLGGFGLPTNDPNKVRTDEAGAFRFASVKAGEYLVRISHADRYMSEEVRVTMQEVPTKIDLRIGLASIEGRVTDPDGLPLEGLLIQANTEGHAREWSGDGVRFEISEDEEGGMNFNSSRSRGGASARTEVRTDSDGRYAFRGVRSRESISLDIRDPYRSRVSIEIPELGPNEVRRNVDFVLEGAGVVSCNAKGMPDGMERIDVRAEFLGEGEHLGRAHSRRILRWRSKISFDSLVPGPWKFEVRSQDGTVIRTFEPQVIAGQTTELSIEFP